MHFIDEGQGPPLLLVHGNPTWSFLWRRLVQDLAADYRVVAVDHIGCGLSDKPQAYDYCLARHTANLVSLVERLDLQDATLVAHDWGGPIGLGALLASESRFKRMVLLNTGAFPPFFCPWRIRVCRWGWVNRWGVRRLNLFARAALRMAVAQPHCMTPAVRAGFLAPYASHADRIAIGRFVQDIPLSDRHRTWSVLASLEAGLRKLRPRPVQLIWGMQDWCFTPACLERLQAIFPQARVRRIETAGHYVIEDEPQMVIETVRTFLKASPVPS